MGRWLRECYDWLCYEDGDFVHAISESEFEEEQMARLRAADCMMVLGCCLPIPFCCCGALTRHNALCNPPDARKLSEEAAKPYIDGLQGG